MKERSQAGVGMNPRQAQIITEEMDNTLWEKGLLGDDCPATLLNTLVYLFGLHFALCGRDEHCQLRHYPSQISIKVGENGRRLSAGVQAGSLFLAVNWMYFCSCL